MKKTEKVQTLKALTGGPENSEKWSVSIRKKMAFKHIDHLTEEYSPMNHQRGKRIDFSTEVSSVVREVHSPPSRLG